MSKEVCFEFENSDSRRAAQEQIEKMLEHPSAVSPDGDLLWVDTENISSTEAGSVGIIARMSGGHYE